ncbi:MAG: (2Fe-2S) ferredoxin domain-containing protein [Candidatus Hadarchaeum sp.]
MPVVKSLEDLQRVREEALRKRQAKMTTGRAQVTVYMSTCGIAAGARETMKAVLDFIEKENLSDIIVKQTGCIGLCEWEPLMEVELTDGPKARYGKVSPERARQIMQQHVIGGHVVEEFALSTE